jgi:hypothetical protein
MCDLRPAGQYRRKDEAHPNLPIEWRGNAILILPDTNEEHEKFLTRWIFSPGVKVISDDLARLTYDDDADYMADIVVVSGHGGGGAFFSEQQGRGRMDLKNAMVNEKDVGKTHTNSLKYILFPACSNCRFGLKDAWLKAFTKEQPIRGILGYMGGYPGEPDGAKIMKSFAKALREKKCTVLEAWKEANEVYGKKDSWAAFIHDDAKNDTMHDWVSGNLSELDKTKKVRWYNGHTYERGGVEASDSPSEIEAIFYQGGKPITLNNNGLSNDDVGFFPGGKGNLLIKRNKGIFLQGDTISIIFYFYRPEKDKMDLTKLLKFDEQKVYPDSLRHLNDDDHTYHMDGFEYLINADEVTEVIISYTVLEESVKYYTSYGEIGSGSEGVHGYFWIAITTPDLLEQTNCYINGVWLRSLPQPPKVEYYDFGEGSVRNNEGTYELSPGSSLNFYFWNVNRSFEKTIGIYSEDGIQIKIGEMFELDGEMFKNVDVYDEYEEVIYEEDKFHVKQDRKSIVLHDRFNYFRGTFHNLSVLSSNGLADKVFYFKVKYISVREEPKEFAIKEYRFRFLQ